MSRRVEGLEPIHDETIPTSGRRDVAVHATRSGLHCEVASSLAELEQHRAAWEALEQRCLEDNFYSSPDVLCSTLRHFENTRRCQVVFVYAQARASADRRLVGCAPFTILPRALRTGGAPVLSTFVGPHSYLSHPLLDRECAGRALSTIWDWIERPDQPWSLVRLCHVGASSPTWALLREELDRRRRAHWVRSSFARAKLRRHESFDAYFAELSSSRRKNLRRRSKRLEGVGEVKFKVHRSVTRAPDLARRFMELEARSWKGDEGSALLRKPDDAAFFTEITSVAATRGRLLFVELTVDGRPVAMTTNFMAGRTLFAFKVAYDPEYHECSPGILAELETVRAFHAETNLEVADSGTAGSSHLDAYWPESEDMQEIYIPTGGYRSELHFRGLVELTRAKRRIATSLASLRRTRGPQDSR